MAKLPNICLCWRSIFTTVDLVYLFVSGICWLLKVCSKANQVLDANVLPAGGGMTTRGGVPGKEPISAD